MRVTCIINPAAGSRNRPESIAEALRGATDPLGWQVTNVLTEGPGHARELTSHARETSDLIVVSGGDGTINEVASALVGSGIPLGVIPSGSGNGFVRALGIPTRREKAIEVIVQSHERVIDVGMLNDRPFLSTAGIGFDAYVARRFAEGKHSRGVWPYVKYGVLGWFAYEPESVVVELEGNRFEERPLLLVVANTAQYGAGAIIAPNASPDDGLLDAVRIAPMSVLRAALTVPLLFLGTIHRSSAYRALGKASTLTVRRPQPGPAQIDGEPVDEGETLVFRVEPKALTVLVPAASTLGS